ncbi:MAG: hypothetical protein P8L30_10195 [Longimicrobiales bacterium]|jgi:hypothetical protein|nr:hypothetical protein [Longimicrobiales bacterium]
MENYFNVLGVLLFAVYHLGGANVGLIFVELLDQVFGPLENVIGNIAVSLSDLNSQEVASGLTE